MVADTETENHKRERVFKHRSWCVLAYADKLTRAPLRILKYLWDGCRMNRIPNQYILTWRTKCQNSQTKVYIYIHTHSDFEICIYKLDSLNGFFYGRHKQIQKHKVIQIVWSDTVTDTETYTELPSQIRKSNTNTA